LFRLLRTFPAWCGGVEDVTATGSGHVGDHATTRNIRTKASACTSLLDNTLVTSSLTAPRRFRGVGYPTLYWLASCCIQLACGRAQQLVVSCQPGLHGGLLPRDPLGAPALLIYSWGPCCDAQLISTPSSLNRCRVNTPLPLLPLIFPIWCFANTTSEVLLRRLYKPAALIHPILSS
jgi:hypothetical protein